MAGGAQTTSSARPKRVGDDLARLHDDTTKKPRFDYRNPSTLAADAPEEDVILDADVIGKSGPQIKRNAVNIDGYESDSDNDNFNARAAERDSGNNGAEKGGSRDEDEDDMFADLKEDVQGTGDGDEDEDLGREGKRRKKDVRFMEPADIEGQVMNSTSGGHVPAEWSKDGKGKGRARAGSVSSESSGDEEARDLLPEELDDEVAAEVGAGGKKKHAPRLDAFNLKDEEEEGKFDESGNFVRKAMDPDAVNDNWMEGLSKKDMRKAKEAQEKRDEERRRKAMESDAVLSSDSLSTLLQHLETGESPLEALQRLERGKVREAKVPKWKQKKQRNGMDVDDTAGEANAPDPIETARRAAVEAITGAADALYGREQHDVYETEREKLMRQYRRETGEDWTRSAAAASAVAGGEGVAKGESLWEYRWSDARDGGEHHGPYDAATMKAWNEAGYFGEGVEFREIGESEWSRLLDVR